MRSEAPAVSPLPHGCAPKCSIDLHFSAVFYGTEQGNFIDVFEAAADRYSVSNARNADAEGFKQLCDVVCGCFAFNIGVGCKDNFLNFSHSMRLQSSFIRSISGPIPSIGERTPPRTWYLP